MNNSNMFKKKKFSETNLVVYCANNVKIQVQGSMNVALNNNTYVLKGISN